MFSHHSIKEKDNQKILYLYINYDFEFANFNNINKETKENVYDQIKDYIMKHKIDFTGGIIYLVLNGIIVSSIFLNAPNLINNQPEFLNNNNEPNPIELKVENIPSDINENLDLMIENDKETETNDLLMQKKEPLVLETNEVNNNPQKPINEPSPIEEPVPITPIETGIIVTLHRSIGIIEQIPLEDYIIGVVGAEMPASFHVEALKAQSVAARTYALKMISQNKVLTDTTSHQVYKDNNQLKSYWGGDFTTYYNKIKNAVVATKGEYISYNNNYIEALYHSTNNGQTESSLDVFGNYYSYLVTVSSPYDKETSSYLREVTKDFNTINNLLGININKDSKIEVISKTTGDSINVISIDNNNFTGKTIREKLGLRSTDFDIVIGDNNVTFVTRGYGHGVGMSQYGANGMAGAGYNYQNILNHYYPGTVINKI